MNTFFLSSGLFFFFFLLFRRRWSPVVCSPRARGCIPYIVRRSMRAASHDRIKVLPPKDDENILLSPCGLLASNIYAVPCAASHDGIIILYPEGDILVASPMPPS